MRRKRPLIIIPLTTILLVLMGITAFVNPERDIIGTWISEENPQYSLEFLADGTCRDFYAKKAHKNYQYIIAEKCDDADSETSRYIKIEDSTGYYSKCFEVKDILKDQEKILVLTDMEKHEQYYYRKLR